MRVDSIIFCTSFLHSQQVIVTTRETQERCMARIQSLYYACKASDFVLNNAHIVDIATRFRIPPLVIQDIQIRFDFPHRLVQICVCERHFAPDLAPLYLGSCPLSLICVHAFGREPRAPLASEDIPLERRQYIAVRGRGCKASWCCQALAIDDRTGFVNQILANLHARVGP